MTPRFHEGLPEPSNLWVRYRPKVWPYAPGWWVDPVRRGAGVVRGRPWPEGVGEPRFEGWAEEKLDDVLWLPPATDGERRGIASAVKGLVEGGVPVIEQLLPHQEPLAETVVVIDWFETLLSRVVEGGSKVAPGLAKGALAGRFVLWPLVWGVTDTEELVEAGVKRLVEAEAAGVVALPLVLEPAARRALADRCPDVEFSVFFHQEESEAGDLRRSTAAAGLEWRLRRPVPPQPSTLRNARWLAGRLAEAAELGSRVGWSASKVQAWYRAAREVDRGARDWLGLAREGNLAIFPWLEPDARAVVEQLAANENSPLLDSLEESYLRGSRSS